MNNPMEHIEAKGEGGSSHDQQRPDAKEPLTAEQLKALFAKHVLDLVRPDGSRVQISEAPSMEPEE